MRSPTTCSRSSRWSDRWVGLLLLTSGCERQEAVPLATSIPWALGAVLAPGWCFASAAAFRRQMRWAPQVLTAQVDVYGPPSAASVLGALQGA